MFNASGSVPIDGLPLNGPATITASALVKPHEVASSRLSISMSLHLNMPSISLSGFRESITLPSVNLSLVSFGIALDVSLGWPNSGTGFSFIFTYSVRVLDESFNLSIHLNLSPQDLDFLYKVANEVIDDFRDEFEDIMMNRLAAKKWARQ